MKEFERLMIDMIGCGLKGATMPVPERFSLRNIFDFAMRHQIFPLVFNAVEKDESFKTDETLVGFDKKYAALCVLDGWQRTSFETISDAFERKGIDYMPLKGSVYKTIYPETYMRSMGDIDILIREEKKDEIISEMEDIGFSFIRESDHELVFEDLGVITIELHKRLIPSYNLDFDKYYSDSWRFADKNDGHRFAMTDEDFFVYAFTHFAKHYRDRGAGIKYVVDFYVYLEKFPELDFSYIEAELEKLKLIKFYRNVRRLLGVWFYGESSDEITDFLTGKIFSFGVFGNEYNGRVSSLIKQKKQNKRTSKVARLFAAIFPPYASMTELYPSLKGRAALLPIYYIVRIIDRIFRPKRSLGTIKNVLSVSQKQVDEYQKDLDYVGLDYYF